MNHRLHHYRKMTPARRFVVLAAALVLAALVFAALSIDGVRSAWAADGAVKPAAESMDGSSLRRLFVPADDPASWPRGDDWKIVEADEFAELVRRCRPVPNGPAAASIGRVDYTARLAGVQLQGEFTATVRSEGPGSVLLPLGGANIAITDARWSGAGTQENTETTERRAWCGVAADGKLYLVVPPAAGAELTLSGTWTRLGRELAEGMDFQFEGLPAAASSLTLDAPTGYTPKSSHGQVSRLSGNGRPEQPEQSETAGVSRWRVELGSHPACRLAVQRDVSPDVPSVVNAERETTWDLQAHEARMQSRFDVWVTGQAADTLTFTLPEDIRLFSVTYGGESLISWRTEPVPPSDGHAGGGRQRGGDQRVIVELPDPLLGKSRPFRLLGTVTPPFGHIWRLPEVELDGASLTRSSLSIAVGGTVELRSLRHPGWRQVQARAGENRQLLLGFEQFRENAPFRVELDHPPPNLAVTGFNHVDLRQSAPELRSSLTYSVSSGTVYDLAGRLPAEWDVLEVRPAVSGAVSQWATSVAPGGQRLLSVELRDGVSPDRPLTLSIRCRRSDLPAAATFDLPVFRPIDVGKLSLSVALTTSRAVVADLEPGGPVDFVGPENWPEDGFAALPPATSDSLTTIWRFGTPRSEGRVSLRPIEMGDGLQESGGRDQGSGVRGQESGVRGQRSGDEQLQDSSVPSSDDFDVSSQGRRDVFAMLSLRTRCDPAPDGRDRHRAVFRFSAPTALPGHIGLPESASVQRVLVDGAATAVFESAAGFDFPAPVAQCRELTVEYDTPARGGLLHRDLAVAPPDTGARVVRTEWTVETADESQLIGSAAWLRRGERAAATWSERLFGPLGRSSGEDAFNPLSVADWRGLFSSSTRREASTSATAASRFDFVGAGNHGEFTARWMPQRAAATARWALFTIALTVAAALRALRVRRRRPVLAVLLTLAATSAVVLTDPNATFCGSVLAGLLVGVLLPTQMLRRRGDALASPALSGGNSTTLQWARPAGAVILAALALSGLSRADEPKPSTAPADTRTASADAGNAARPNGTTAATETPGGKPAWDVLVPLDAEGTPAPAGLIYVRQDVLAALESTSATEPPRYLLTASHYETSVEDSSVVRVSAAFEVVPLVAGPVDVRLAFEGADLAKPDCLVNGVPTVPRIARDESLSVRIPWTGPAVADASDAADTIHIPAEAPARIEMELLAPRPRREAGSAFGFGLPASPSNQLLARFGFPVESLVVSAGDGAIRRSGEFGLAAVQFGRADAVRVQWGRVNAESLPRSFTALTRSLVTVNPLLVRHRARVACRVEGEPLRTLELSLPAAALLQEVGGDEVARWTVIEESAPDQTSAPGQTGRTVLLEFASPRVGDFTVELIYEVPRTGRNTTVVIAPDDITTPVEPATTTPAAGYAVGIDARSGYQVELVDNPAQQAGIRTIPPETFAADFRQSLVRGESVRSPALALQTERPVPVRLALSPKTVTRRIDLAQRGLITGREITWEAVADVAIENAAAYSHELLVPPSFELTDVSVVEDEAERLARWSRAGERLTLWLGGGTTGEQRIRLRGRLPLMTGQPVALPVVEFADAEIRSYRVQVDRSPRTTVRFTSPPPLTASTARPGTPNGIAPAIAAGSPEAIEVASWPAPSPEPPEVIVTRLPSPLTYESLTTVRPVDRQQVEITSWVSVENPSRTNRPLALVVPNTLPLSVAGVTRSDGRRAEIRTVVRPGTAGRVFRLQEPLAPHASAVLRLTGTVNRSEDGRGELPLCRVADGLPRARYLWTPWPLSRDTRGSDVSVKPPAAPALPAWAQAAGVKLPTDTGMLIALDPSAEVWGVDWPGSATADRRAYAETALFMTGEEAHYFGRTSLLVSAGRGGAFEMPWPPELSCDAVLLDGEAVPADLRPGESLRISVPAGRPATVVVLWSSSGKAAGSPGSPEEIDDVVLPRLPAGLEVMHTLITVPPPGVSMLTVNRHAATSQEIAIERVARLLEWWANGNENSDEINDASPQPVPPVLSSAWTELQSLTAGGGESLSPRDQDRMRRLRQKLADLAGADFDAAAGRGVESDADVDATPAAIEPLVPLASLPPETWLISAELGESRPSMWAAGGTAGRAAIGTLLFAVLCVVAVWLASSGMVRPLRRHPGVACVLGGVVWWTCWTWSAAGLLLAIGGAIAIGLYTRFTPVRMIEASSVGSRPT